MATESSSTCGRPNKSFQTPFPAEDSLLLPDLLPEIIVEILSRLPVKSLLRFRCVSKSWRSLISQPKFAKTHLSLASGNTDYANHRLILSLNWHNRLQFFEQYPLTDVRSCSLNSILNEQFVTAVELDCPLKVPYRPVSILGCCDGLVCITNGRELCVWNPSTRKSKRLPNVELPVHYIGRYGFGYDESIDDYKVVGFFRDFGDSASEVEVKVYALRSDSWRRIGGFPFCLPLDGLVTCLNGIFVNGALHWFSGGNCGRIIVSLDLVNETYGEVLEPDYRHGRLYEISLDVINGCLTVLATYCNCTELWLMKEYGVIESWTKLVVIPYVEHPVDGQYARPLCILKNGEFVLLMLSELVLYNPKNGTFKYPRIRNCSLCFTVYTYIESLVSLDIDADSGV